MAGVAAWRVQSRAAKRDPGRGSIWCPTMCNTAIKRNQSTLIDGTLCIQLRGNIGAANAPNTGIFRLQTRFQLAQRFLTCRRQQVVRNQAQLQLFYGKERDDMLPAQMTTVSTASSRFFPPTEISIPSSQMRSYEQPLMLSTALSYTKHYRIALYKQKARKQSATRNK